jgi:alpha-amylase/alpha-mannosidase (GH57 family)
MGYICIHNHFYQPPRENPWLEAVELQDSAYPYHDWNERITAECYAPNGASRILDAENRIRQIVNNYAATSFNFGPTLLSWLKSCAPQVYQLILDADRQSLERFSGHGSAIAQAYNHMILPLANTRDKSTQILWGIADFEHHFGRKPEGMWLPETAVDLESLELMAQQGIKFTILAPRQAARVRRIGGRNWTDVQSEKIDPTRAYRCRLSGRRTIALFFYDGPISRAVAFEGVLDNGERLAERLLGAFSETRDWPELVHIATDGETYGHHHAHGEMALSYALNHIESKELAEITNYGEFLERHPPTHDVEIIENSSWSCVHGIERWKSDCGCNSGRQGWNQAWRAPLRQALDGLRDGVVDCFQARGGELFKDPWAARNDYIQVVLDRAPARVSEFIAKHATHELTDEETVKALRLMELQRHLMLMYTSCGWFFDDISGIETVQVIQYAARAVQLAQDVFGEGLESHLVDALAAAKSNIAEHQDGACIYRKFAKPAMVTLQKVAAHYAISSLFKPHSGPTPVYHYNVDEEDYRSMESGKTKLAIGHARFSSEITRVTETLVFSALHLGDHNLNCGIAPFAGEEAFQKMVSELTAAFSRADLPETLRLMDKEFGEARYSLKSLFRDGQRAVLKEVLTATLDEAETSFKQIHENQAPLINFLRDLGVPLPKAMRASAEAAVNSLLRHEFATEDMDAARVQSLLEESRASHVDLDAATLEYTLRKTIERQFDQFMKNPADPEVVKRLLPAVHLARSLPFEVVLWSAQNAWFDIKRTAIDELAARNDAEGDAHVLVEQFRQLGEELRISVN